MADPMPALWAAYDGLSPSFASEPAFAGAGAAVLGRARLGSGVWLGAWSVIRADGHHVEIGDDFHLGAHATVHIAHDVYPTHVGDRVTAGPGAVIHACEVGDGCVVERDAVILDGSCVGAGAIISAGSVVFPRSDLEGGWLYAGSPAKPVARVLASEHEAYHRKVRNHEPMLRREGGGGWTAPGCFVAPTALVRGRVATGADVGIWYGCMLDAGAHRIAIGDGTNIQDNSVVVCDETDVMIGADVTIGHNASLTDCVVKPASLVGIGAVLAPGTIVESDALVAAGTQTEPGQRLTCGQVWAGRPARPIGPMDDRKRAMMAETLQTYRDYARRFRQAQYHPLNLAREE